MPIAAEKQSASNVTEPDSVLMRALIASAPIGRAAVSKQVPCGNRFHPGPRFGGAGGRGLHHKTHLDLLDAIRDVARWSHLVSRRAIGGREITEGKFRALTGVVVQEVEDRDRAKAGLPLEAMSGRIVCVRDVTGR